MIGTFLSAVMFRGGGKRQAAVSAPFTRDPALDAERLRLAEIKRTRKAARQSKGFSNG